MLLRRVVVAVFVGLIVVIFLAGGAFADKRINQRQPSAGEFGDPDLPSGCRVPPWISAGMAGECEQGGVYISSEPVYGVGSSRIVRRTAETTPTLSIRHDLPVPAKLSIRSDLGVGIAIKR